MGDFNEDIGLDPHGMASVITAGGLVDSYTTRHGLHNEPSTYARGQKRVDYIFISEHLLPYLVRSGFEPFNHRIYSDHRGCFIDLSIPGLFNRSLTTLATPPNRNLCSTNHHHVQKYIRAVNDYFLQHHVMPRLATLALAPNHEEAEKLDNDITRAMLHAELQCKSYNRLPWSTDLHQAMTTLYILKMRIT